MNLLVLSSFLAVAALDDSVTLTRGDLMCLLLNTADATASVQGERVAYAIDAEPNDALVRSQDAVERAKARVWRRLDHASRRALDPVKGNPDEKSLRTLLALVDVEIVHKGRVAARGAYHGGNTLWWADAQ